MAKILSKSGISSLQIVRPWHVTQSIDAFTGEEEYNIYLSGSFNTTGSITATGNISGSSRVFGTHMIATTAIDTPVLENSIGTSIKIKDAITASSDISASGTITMLTASIGGGIFTSASLAAGGGGGGSTFPFTGDAQITGSLLVTGSNFISGTLHLMHPEPTVPVIKANNESFLFYAGNDYHVGNTGGSLNFIGSSINFNNGAVTASVDISSSANIIANTGSFSHLQGNSPITVGDQVIFQQDAQITGSLLVTGSNTISGSLLLGQGLFSDTHIKVNNESFLSDMSGFYFVGNTNTTLQLTGKYLLFGGPGAVTSSVNISSSGTVSMLTASIGGGTFTSSSLASAIAGGGGGGSTFPFTGDAVITGSLVVNASSSTSQSLSVIGSGSTVFDVIGSVGTLFSVDDNLTETLFTANDISGLPVLQASASGEVLIGKSPQSLYSTAVVNSTTAATSHSLCTLSTSSYAGAFFEYTAFSGSHDARAGNIMAIWSGSAINFTETTTTDFGSTSDLTMEVVISGSTARLITYGPNAGYKVKTIIKAI